MLDQDGRVWYTARIRAPNNGAFCQEGSDHPSAKAFPTTRANRQLSLLDPQTGEYTFIDTCYSTHHLQFAYDDNNTLWTSGGGEVIGWLDTQQFLETGDAQASQGWTPAILDTNGNGRRDAYVEPGDPVNPELDKRIIPAYYAIMPNPADGSIWGSNRSYPGSVVRLELGDNPAETALAEVYNVPKPGFGIRGADIDSNGVIWGSLASGHLSEFDRSKCQGPLNGPRRWAITAPRAGRCTAIPVRASRARGDTASSRATTAGSISTTPRGSERTCRCPRRTSTTACTRWSTASG